MDGLNVYAPEPMQPQLPGLQPASCEPITPRIAAAARDLRLLECPQLGPERLMRLRSSGVAVIGVGALGGPLAIHLAMLGVPTICVDPDTISESNLANQMWPAAAVGRPKSVVRAEQMRDLNPEAQVLPVQVRIEDLGMAALSGVGVLATATDGRASRMHVAELSTRLGIPMMDAAVDGSGRSLYATLTLFDPRREGTACYACRHDAASLAAIAREQRGPGCPSWRRAGTPVSPPTLQASAFAAMVAGLQAIIIVRVLLGEADVLVGRQLVMRADGVPMLRPIELAANPRCLLGHERLWPLVAVPGERVADVLTAAAIDLGRAAESLRFHGRNLVNGLICVACGRTRDVLRLAEAFAATDVACTCGREMVPAATSDRVDGDALRRLAGLTWDDVGAPVADVVTVSGGGAAVDYVVNHGAGLQAATPESEEGE